MHAESGCIYIDAPIFGRPEAATAKKLWIPFTGPQSSRERVAPILKAMGAQGIFYFGEEPGVGNLVKLIGNFLISSAVRSMREAPSVAEKSGVHLKSVVDMLTQTLSAAPIYQSYGKMIAEKTLSFYQNKIPLKDIGLFQATAK